jgi:hypothetical protein
VSVIYALDLWKPAPFRRLRWELAVHTIRDEFGGFSGHSNHEYFLRLSTSLLLRTWWGQIGYKR